MNEQWRPVVGFEGEYEVSDRGRVRSLARSVLVVRHGRLVGSFLRYVPERLLRAYRNVKRGGYRYVNLRTNGGQKLCRVAVLVAAAFISPRPKGMQVCHKNGIADDDRRVNLRYGTPLSNAADQKRHGTRKKKAAHPMAKLSEAEVSAIRKLHNVVPKKKLAAAYGVSVGHISNLQNGWRW